MQTNQFSCLPTFVMITLLLWFGRSPVPGAESRQMQLPGARPDIDAAYYPSLQAALDALPPEGGLVRLPAGTFEVKEPLLLMRSDVHLEGAGTATHIKNMNTNGQGIDLRDAHGCAVSANTFTINATDALKVGPGSGRITVTGNNFSNSYIGDGQLKRGTNDLAAAGITLSDTSDVVIAGNLFSGVQPQAITTQGPASRRVLFSNNVLTDVRQDSGNLRNSKVESNLVSAEKSPEPPER